MNAPKIQPADFINNVDPDLLKLHLGCGHNYMPTWVNIDRADVRRDLMFDLDSCGQVLGRGSEFKKLLPYDDNTVDMIYCAHTLEHITHILPLMQELYRVAKPNAPFLAIVPHGSNDAAFEDPTHVRHFFNKSFQYFGQSMYGRADYGYRGDWVTESLYLSVNNADLSFDQEETVGRLTHQRNFIQEFAAIMRACKPMRTECLEMDEPDVYILKAQR